MAINLTRETSPKTIPEFLLLMKENQDSVTPDLVSDLLAHWGIQQNFMWDCGYYWDEKNEVYHKIKQ
jgi:hypothetical protein